jgi:mannitol 2-dehydrogenase
LTAEVAVPSYDRSRVKSGIAHLGVGGFQRSHLAVYTDDLLQSAGNDEAAIAWGICGVGKRIKGENDNSI